MPEVLPVEPADSHALSGWAYTRLPAAVRQRDEAEGFPLKQLVNVLGESLGYLKDQGQDFLELIDVDRAPAEFLPSLGAVLGFEFPYDLGEALQRNFIRSIVSMYRIKGTPLAMRYVVNRLIAGQGFKLDITNEDYQAKTFDVILTAEESASGTEGLQSKITYLVGLYSPAGMIPRVVILFYQAEEFDVARFTEGASAAIEFTRWNFTVAGHTFNTKKPSGSVVSMNSLGQQPVDI